MYDSLDKNICPHNAGDGDSCDRLHNSICPHRVGQRDIHMNDYLLLRYCVTLQCILGIAEKK